jgi:hypothetical protein
VDTEGLAIRWELETIGADGDNADVDGEGMGRMAVEAGGNAEVSRLREECATTTDVGAEWCDAWERELLGKIVGDTAC